MTLLGVVVALKAEAMRLVKKPLELGESLYLPEGILVRQSGIGHKKARFAAISLIEKGASSLLSWGCAGGLNSSLPTGCLILPKKIYSFNQTCFPVDASWHERICNRLKGHIDLNTGPLIQVQDVLSSPGEKTSLFKQYGALAVDMESATVAQVAQQAQIPFIAIRAISDPAKISIPSTALRAIDEVGGLRPFLLIKALARHPDEILPLIRLGRYFRAAVTTLETVRRLAGPRFLAP